MSEAAKHTPGPWFVSGVRHRMNGGEWHGINRYDEAKKRDENIACVGYDPRTGVGLADAHFIVRAVNSYADMLAALRWIADAAAADGNADIEREARAAIVRAEPTPLPADRKE